MRLADARVSEEHSGARSITSQARSLQLPDDVLEKARHHLLDTVAAMVSGSRLRAGVLATAYVRSLAGAPLCTVVGADCLTTPVDAALANGMMAHADETDDSHLGGRFHPGCGIVPARLPPPRSPVRAAEISSRRWRSDTTSARASIFRSGPRKLYAGGHSTHSVGPLFGGAAAAGCSDGFLAGADPPSAVLCGPAGVRDPMLVARRSAYREGIRLRRHDGAQRFDGRDDGGRRIHRRCGRLVRRQQLLHGLLARSPAGRAVEGARYPFRNPGRDDQEMVRRLSGPGRDRYHHALHGARRSDGRAVDKIVHRAAR